MAASDFVSIVFVLRCGQPGSRPGHRNEVAFFDDWRASPDDLRLATRTNVEVGQPDVVTVRMRANLDNSPHDDAFGTRGHQANLAPYAISCIFIAMALTWEKRVPQTAVPEDHMRPKAFLARRT